MIEKLDKDCGKLQKKINELVDAVNTIQKEREAERFEIQEWIGILEAVRKSVNVHEKQIDELQKEPKLKRCPFCGGKPVLLPDNTVECMTTDCPMHPDYIMPIEKWNKRK